MAYQLLWLCRMSMVGLTEEILLDENKLEDGEDDIAIHNQLSSVGEGQLLELKAKCEKRLNLSESWEDEMYFDQIAPYLPAWRALKTTYGSKKLIEGKKQPKKKLPAVVEDDGQGGLF